MATGQTANYALPWPDGQERVRDGDNAIRALAEAVDTRLKATPPTQIATVDAALGPHDERYPNGPLYSFAVTQGNDGWPATYGQVIGVRSGGSSRHTQLFVANNVSGAGANGAWVRSHVSNTTWGAWVRLDSYPTANTSTVLAGTLDATKPLTTRSGVATVTTGSDSVAALSTGFTTCLASIVVQQAGTGATSSAQLMIRSDTTQPGTARVLVTNAAGSGLASTSVMLAWIAVGQ